MRDSQWTRVDADWFAKGRELEMKRHAMATAYADIPTTYESSVETRTSGTSGRGRDEEAHEQCAQQIVTLPVIDRSIDTPKLRRTNKRAITPPHLTRLHSELPPTPPTMANSEDAEPRAESTASNAQFADAVRKALHGQKSASSTWAHQLPSPDLTPPAISDVPASPSRRSSFLQPLRTLRLRPSSRSDSYHTARETQTPGASQIRLAPRTPSPEPQSTSSWLSFLSEDPYASSTGAGSPRVGQTPLLSHRPSHLSHISETSGLSSGTPTPAPLQPRKRAHSPYRPLTPSEDDDELDRHVSYIADQFFEERPQSPSPHSPVHSDSDLEEHVSYLSDHTPQEDADTEHVNNLVYKHIREENVKRHSIISNDNALTSGIWFPEQFGNEHRLRRTIKAQSLRHASGSSAG